MLSTWFPQSVNPTQKHLTVLFVFMLCPVFKDQFRQTLSGFAAPRRLTASGDFSRRKGYDTTSHRPLSTPSATFLSTAVRGCNGCTPTRLIDKRLSIAEWQGVGYSIIPQLSTTIWYLAMGPIGWKATGVVIGQTGQHIWVIPRFAARRPILQRHSIRRGDRSVQGSNMR